MSDFTLQELAGFAWMQSRIPALDALVAFLPAGKQDAAVTDVATGRPSRWYPTDGGHRVVVLYDEKFPYDPTKWHVEQGAWDHEHCDRCGKTIPPMTLCWVTEHDPYVLLCASCHSEVMAADSSAD